MDQVAGYRAEAPKLLNALYAPVRGELDQVEDLLREELRSDYPFVDRLVKHGFRLGGKRIRPALVLLSAKASGALKAEHLKLAAAVELIHTATLVHDDVLDEAALRRHLDTINARWDNEASILLGDYLFTCSIRLAGSLDDAFACHAIGQAGQSMCQAELRQIESRGNYDLSEEDYLDIIAGKTAALTACCCRLGAHYAGADADTREAFTRFGQCLGVAFQIADDLLDLLGDESVAGKSLGTDLLKQKPTLPLIHVLRCANPRQREEVVSVLSCSDNHHRDALQPWLDRFDALSYARDKALSYAREAGEQLSFLPQTAARDALTGLTDFVVNRKQ